MALVLTAKTRRGSQMKILGVVLLLMGLGSLAFAGPATAPEVSPASAGGALTLLSGILLVMRGRRKK
jgi:uncharacterized membrane protein HdeD (DUF308 family)